jgi:hypothetical protein
MAHFPGSAIVTPKQTGRAKNQTLVPFLSAPEWHRERRFFEGAGEKIQE